MQKTYIVFEDEGAIESGLPPGVSFVSSGIFSINEGESLPAGATVGSGADFDSNVKTFLADEKKRLLTSVKEEHAAAINLLTSNKTPEERDTWPVKVLFAEKLDKGELSPVERSIVEKSLIEGETVEQYLQLVKLKFAAFADLSFFAEGFKRQTNQAIENLETLQERDTLIINSSASMASAISQYKAALAG